ncbi:hypothetical protein M3P05_15140 [Sansalvadorimonas sp. 2012CJ34-2]|uniref:Uncharacterized protein n=1 Tax=Parendozoicomonas callyspongiae TaxID=2942213 RepID=A0ABT0PIT0_9GAMM|nr:hypothetical protein [Sansalvadorimonas sp. 2012CJ34-2]MCL6271260.1 hypothetical protein [Sansalvadorimonas sp. 2012CJ34-2]
MSTAAVCFHCGLFSGGGLIDLDHNDTIRMAFPELEPDSELIVIVTTISSSLIAEVNAPGSGFSSMTIKGSGGGLDNLFLGDAAE